MTDEDLHAVVYRETRKESMKKLTQGAINTVARVLQNMKDSASGGTRAKRTDVGGDARTVQQRRKIYVLTESLGWNDNPQRIQGFVKGASKNCPLYILPHWEQFKAKVAAKLAELNGAASETPAEKTKTAIMGEAQATAQQMALYCRNKNAEPQITSCTLEELAGMFLEEGRAEGVRGDVAWAQSLHETGFFKFGGIVLPTQNNFAGIGALNGNATGQAATFPDPRTGVRAQIQHLKAYASTEPLVNACVDPRFSLVARGCAPWVEWLGASDNPQGKGWAVPGKGYGASVVKLLGAILAQETPQSPAEPQEADPLAQFPEWQRRA